MSKRENNKSVKGSAVYAVDFDGTLFQGAEFPEIGLPNMELINFLKERKAEGDKIILWTCRAGENLEKAVKKCSEQGLFFDAVNDNLQENIEKYGGNTRKVCADFYIDDCNMIPFSEKVSGYLKINPEKDSGKKLDSIIALYGLQTQISKLPLPIMGDIRGLLLETASIIFDGMEYNGESFDTVEDEIEKIISTKKLCDVKEIKKQIKY